MAETSYPLQVVLGLVDKLTRPWSETLEHLANTENRWLAGAARAGHIVLEQGVDILKEAFHSGAEIERSINRIRAASHGAELEMLEDRQALVAIGRETLAGTHDAAKAVDVLAHSGNDLAAAFLEATPALELADVAQMDVAASARLLDRQLDAYGLTAADAAEAADLLARSSLKLGETIPATADAFSSLAPIARVLHVPLETVAEMLLALHE
jgi:TP901 family phage tail tape measure protein